MNFCNSTLNRIYKYIYIHDGETVLRQDIADYVKISLPTLRKHLRWLEKRELIKIDRKIFHILQPN